METSRFNESLLQPIKYALLIGAYAVSTFVVSRNWDLFRRKHFALGVAAQFVLCCCTDRNFQLLRELRSGELRWSNPIAGFAMARGIGFVLFMLGRLCGSAVISQLKAHRVLATYMLTNAALLAVTMRGGKAGLYAMFASFFFMSVGFPTIFALGIGGLGEHTKLASSLIVMSIVGGAITPPFMGHGR